MSYYWTEEQIDVLRRCVDQGLTADATAERIPGRTVGAVRTKADELGLKFTRKVPAEPEARTVAPRSRASLTAFILGDPPPGRSALDQRAHDMGQAGAA